MLRSLQVIFFGCGILTVLFVIISAVIYYLASNSLPVYTQTHETDKITQSVTITRDSFAVPYIRGGSDKDNFFALGYTHAQDRLWQMELSRRTAQGRLSEIFGKSALESDILTRTLNIYKLSQLAEKKQSKEVIEILKAYSAGINSYINQISSSGLGRGSPEFFLFTSQIAPWRPADCIALMKLVGLQSTNKAEREILRTQLMLENINQKRLADIFEEPPLIDSGANRDMPISRNLFPILKNYEATEFNYAIEKSYSNSFSSSGLTASNIFASMPSRSANGSSLVAIDPHGFFSAPSNFMLVGIDFKTGPVMGGTIPGIPAILIGRGRHIGWGFANAYIDDQDLFLEKVNPNNQLEYFSPAGLSEFEKKREIINIKGEKPVTIDILKTQNGPILPGNVYGVNSIRPNGHEISINWTGLKVEDKSIEAFISLMKATSIKEAQTALPLLTVPGQNILIADKNNISIFTAGAVPDRDFFHSTQGKIPSLGWQKNNAWLGIKAFEENPSIINPKSGILINTNNRITQKDFPNHISFDWGDSQRIIRANNLLQKRQFHTVNSFMEIQNDTVSISARILLPLLAKSLWFKQKNESDKILPEIVNSSLEILSEWNGDMSQHSAAPLIYVGWIKEFQKMIMADDMGNLYKSFKNVNPLFLERVLRNKNGAGEWCNITQTKDTETCDDLSEKALINAVNQLKKKFGTQIKSWRWGEAHIAVHKSDTFKSWPILSFLTNIVHEISGGDNTMLMSRMANPQNNQFSANYGSTLRAIYDFSSSESALFIISTGQSGHFLSRHYDDQSTLWQKQEYLSLKLDLEARTGSTVGTITFNPSSSKAIN